FRGGLGVIRDYRARAPVTVSLSAERQTVPPRGLDGGEDGRPGVYLVNPGRDGEKRLPAAVGEYALAEGDVLSIRTPGGAGFGPPRERDRKLVLRDLREGRISAEAATRVYGLEPDLVAKASNPRSSEEG